MVIVTARHFLSLVRTVFFREFGFYITGSINLFVYVCLILISLHVIELCLCPYLPFLAPVCVTVSLCVTWHCPGMSNLFVFYYSYPNTSYLYVSS